MAGRAKAVPLIIISFILSSCGADSVWRGAYDSLKLAVKGAPELEITRASVDQTPYAMIAVRIGKMPGAILVLSEQRGGANYWLSSNNVSVITRSGRLLRTVGLERDLGLAKIEGGDPLSQAPHQLQEPIEYRGHMEVFKPRPDNFSFECRMEPKQPEQITIAELQFETIHLVEECRTSGGWKYKNHFWVDPWDGFVWQSRQHFVKGIDPMIIRVLKPAA